ncbi:putative ribonuclease H-like domain-containing protein [Tanacetum coccineum]
MVPRTVLSRSSPILINTVRPFNTVQPRTSVNNTGPMKNVINNAYSTARRPFNKITTANNSNFTKKVNSFKGTRVNIARPKAVLSVVKGNKGNAVKASACWVWRPKHKILDHVSRNNGASMSFKRFDYIDVQGRSKHMTGNRSYLTDYEEIDGGFVAFGGNSKGEKITGKDFKLTDESHVLLKVPRKDNMYNVDLNNVVPQGGLTCLFVNATPDESNLWHRRLRHVNFKTMNKLVRGNHVRDHLGKFDGKADEGFFVGYSTNSKAFRVFNSRTRIVEENLHVQFSENTSNIARSGPNWLFDIDALTKSMNYKPVVAGNQSNGNAGTKACDDAGKARVETVPGKDYILLPLWTQDPPFSSSLKDSPDAGFNPSGEEEKKDVEDPGNESRNPPKGKDSEVPSIEELRINQEKNASVNSTNNINNVSPTVNAASIKDNAVNENIVYECADDQNIPNLEEIGRFSDDEDDGVEADMTNLDTHIPVSPIPTTRIHKDYPVKQIIRDIHSAPQTRRMTKSVTKHAMFSLVQQRTNHKDFQNCLFACFLSQAEPKKVWTLVDLPHGKRAIGTKWVYRNKKDERGIVIRNKARLIEEEVYVCQPLSFEDPYFPNRVYKVEKALYGLHQATRAWYETLSTYLLENRFQRGQIDKILFIKRDQGDILIVQVYVDDIIFGSTKKKLCTKFEKMMHKKFQMSSMGELTFFLGLQVKFQVNPKVSHLHAVKRIFRYLKGQPKLGLWYPKDLPFDLVAYTDSDYARASLDRKSTTRVKNPVFHSKKKHIEIRHHFIRDSSKKKLIQMIKIHTDKNIADLLTKAFDVSRFQYLIASIGMLNI